MARASAHCLTFGDFRSSKDRTEVDPLLSPQGGEFIAEDSFRPGNPLDVNIVDRKDQIVSAQVSHASPEHLELVETILAFQERRCEHRNEESHLPDRVLDVCGPVRAKGNRDCVLPKRNFLALAGTDRFADDRPQLTQVTVAIVVVLSCIAPKAYGLQQVRPPGNCGLILKSTRRNIESQATGGHAVCGTGWRLRVSSTRANVSARAVTSLSPCGDRGGVILGLSLQLLFQPGLSRIIGRQCRR
jgi:hypothetical protein